MPIFLLNLCSNQILQHLRNLYLKIEVSYWVFSVGIQKNIKENLVKINLDAYLFSSKLDRNQEFTQNEKDTTI